MNNIASLLLCTLLLSCSSDGVGRREVRDTAAAAPVPADTAAQRRTVIVFGNSLTAGYGLDDPGDAYPGLLQARIDSLGLGYEVVNAGLSGETSAGGDGRVEWVLRRPVDVFLLELGGNDGLRGIPVEETRRNLQSIIDKVRKRSPKAVVVLAGMQAPPNMGPAFTDGFRELYPALANRNRVPLIPFLLEGVAGEPSLNQPDGIHPTAQGHRILLENVWKVLGPLL